MSDTKEDLPKRWRGLADDYLAKADVATGREKDHYYGMAAAYRNCAIELAALERLPDGRKDE